MKDLRIWALILALTAFAAGIGVGVWAAARRFHPETADGPFSDYEAMLARRFDLAPERRRLLHSVLDAYRRDVEEIRGRSEAQSMSAMEPELTERGRYYRNLIQDKVLPETQRAEFERLAFQPNPTR
ncbi:MAG: hypothetical protein HZA53_03230 [Planctomycetes bacterium]|nr:hypothetical protein [Planctomycetota bacterium]